METQNTTTSNQEQILKVFRQLLSERQQGVFTIATKQETAQREADKKVVEKASTYTAKNIVKGIADLQLNFGNAVESLVEKLAVEAPKLEELRRAIQVETQHLDKLRNIRIAADALDILMQEHQAKTTAFEEKSQQERQTLEQDIAEEKQAWQQEQQEFDTARQERQKLLQKERTQHEADYQYDLERMRKIEVDEYTNHKAALERKITEDDAKKVADWTEREKILAAQQETLKKYRSLVESFPQELEKATQKARAEAITEVQEDARVQAALFEKEREANQQVHELKLVSLQETIQQHATQIEALSTQLQTALTQVQDLAVKALDTGMAA